MEPIRSELTMRRIAGRTAAQVLVESDIPLPAGRDAQRILYAQGAIGTSTCRCVNSQVQAEGNLTLNLLCVGKDNLPFGMQASTQYSHDVPLSEVQEGMSAIVQPQLVDIRTSLRDQRIHVEAVAELNTIAIDTGKTQALCDVAGVSNLQKLYLESEIGERRLIGKEQKRIHEVIPAQGIEQLLLFSGKAQATSANWGDTEASVQSVLYISALYLDGQGQYTQLSQQIPVNETIELDADPRSLAKLTAQAEMDDIYVTLGEQPGTLELDATITLSAVGVSTLKLQTLADAYAPDESMNCVRRRMEQLSVVGDAVRVCTYNESVKIPDTLPEAFRAVFASARPTILGVTNDSGQLAIDGILITGIVYQTDDGSAIGFEEDVPFTCTLDAPFMPDAQPVVNLLETRVSGGGHVLSVAFTIEAKAQLSEVVDIEVAVDIEPMEPRIRENGILIHYASAGETYWDIGKRFGVPASDVKKWNDGVMEPFEEGQAIMLLSASGRKR